MFEKYHQSYAKITTFSVFKGVSERLVLCISQNLRKTKNPDNSILYEKKGLNLGNVSFLAARNLEINDPITIVTKGHFLCNDQPIR